MPATSVKFLHSAMSGAPSLTGQVGALIAVLDACLVNGFGLRTVNTLTVASNVATMDISTGHPFEVGSVVEVAGAAPPGLNGEQRITAVNGNLASFATSGISDQTATGSITAKLAPAGWGKPFSGTNLGVYRSSDVTGNRHYLRIDDNYTTDPRSARVVGYETMSAVSSGTGPFPTVLQAALGAFCGKSASANATTRAWCIFADEKFFYLAIQPNSPTQSCNTYFFGEPIGFKTPDPYNTVLGFSSGDLSSGGQFQGGISHLGGGSPPENFSSFDSLVPRASTGLGTARSIGRVTAGGLSAGGSGVVSGFTYPNAADNALHLTEILMVSEGSYRARFPGVYFCPQNTANSFATRDIVLGTGLLAGRRFLAMPHTTGLGVVFFDITDSWR